MNTDPPWLVVWEPRSFGIEDRWTARLPSRGRVAFATVGIHLDGIRYTVCLSPKGIAGPHTWFYTRSFAKARHMIERWTRHHWQSVTPSPRHWSGTSAVKS